MGVKVGVRLSRFFCDERAAALLWVEAPLRKVRDLHERLRRLFRLTEPFCLLKDGFLLPSSEDLALLDSGDVVTVMPLAAEFDFDCENEPENDLEIEKDTKKKKRKKQKEQIEDSISVDEGKKDKDKENSPAVTPERAPKKKCSPLDDPDVLSAIENIERLHAELAKPMLNDDEELEEPKTKILTAVSDGRIKKKRIRIRKSKKNNTSIVNSLSDGESGGSHRSNGLVLLNGKVNSHIRFQSSENSPITVVRNKQCTADDKPRIIQPIQQNTPEIVEASDIKQEYSLDYIVKTLDKFTVIHECPKENDVVLFKTLKMDENYSPSVSGHILGKVSSVCTETSSVKFSILDGHAECAMPVGKFDIEDEDESISNTNTEFDVLWNQVIEPRIIEY